MNKKERVLAAIAHREGDRAPKGEVAIEPGSALHSRWPKRAGSWIWARR